MDIWDHVLWVNFWFAGNFIELSGVLAEYDNLAWKLFFMVVISNMTSFSTANLSPMNKCNLFWSAFLVGCHKDMWVLIHQFVCRGIDGDCLRENRDQMSAFIFLIPLFASTIYALNGCLLKYLKDGELPSLLRTGSLPSVFLVMCAYPLQNLSDFGVSMTDKLPHPLFMLAQMLVAKFIVYVTKSLFNILIGRAKTPEMQMSWTSDYRLVLDSLVSNIFLGSLLFFFSNAHVWSLMSWITLSVVQAQGQPAIHVKTD